MSYPVLDLEEVEPGSGGNGELRLWPAAAAVPTRADVRTVVTTFTLPPVIDLQLLLDGPNLYARTPYQLLRVAKTGGAPVVLASGPEGTFDQPPTNALGMVVDDAFIYFLDAGHGRILKLPK